MFVFIIAILCVSFEFQGDMYSIRIEIRAQCTMVAVPYSYQGQYKGKASKC